MRLVESHARNSDGTLSNKNGDAPGTLYRAVAWLSGKAMSVAGWSYLLIALIIGFDIFARRLLGFSTEATTELTGYLLAVGMAWGLAGTLMDRAHVRVDVLVQKLPLTLRVWLHLVSLLLLLLVTGFFVYGSVSLALDSFAINATDISVLRTPLVLPQGLWAAGFVLFLLAGVAVCLRSLRQMASGRAAAADRVLSSRSYEDEAVETLEAVGADAAALAPKIARGSRS